MNPNIYTEKQFLLEKTWLNLESAEDYILASKTKRKLYDIRHFFLLHLFKSIPEVLVNRFYKVLKINKGLNKKV
jgi:hypothetical protein